MLLHLVLLSATNTWMCSPLRPATPSPSAISLAGGYKLTHCEARFFSPALLVYGVNTSLQKAPVSRRGDAALSALDKTLPASCFRRSSVDCSVMIRRLDVAMSWNRGQTRRRSLLMLLCVLIEASAAAYSFAHAQRFLPFEKCLFFPLPQLHNNNLFPWLFYVTHLNRAAI